MINLDKIDKKRLYDICNAATFPDSSIMGLINECEKIAEGY